MLSKKREPSTLGDFGRLPREIRDLIWTSAHAKATFIWTIWPAYKPRRPSLTGRPKRSTLSSESGITPPGGASVPSHNNAIYCASQAIYDEVTIIARKGAILNILVDPKCRRECQIQKPGLFWDHDCAWFYSLTAVQIELAERSPCRCEADLAWYVLLIEELVRALDRKQELPTLQIDVDPRPCRHPEPGWGVDYVEQLLSPFRVLRNARGCMEIQGLGSDDLPPADIRPLQDRASAGRVGPRQGEVYSVRVPQPMSFNRPEPLSRAMTRKERFADYKHYEAVKAELEDNRRRFDKALRAACQRDRSFRALVDHLQAGAYTQDPSPGNERARQALQRASEKAQGKQMATS